MSSLVSSMPLGSVQLQQWCQVCKRIGIFTWCRCSWQQGLLPPH